MEEKRNCPDCQGTMVLTPGVGGLFWRCGNCGKKLPYASGELKDYED